MTRAIAGIRIIFKNRHGGYPCKDYKPSAMYLKKAIIQTMYRDDLKTVTDAHDVNNVDRRSRRSMARSVVIRTLRHSSFRSVFVQPTMQVF